MACFLVPVTEAVVVTAIDKIQKKNETDKTYKEGAAFCERAAFSKKLGWLRTMLWGGSSLLAFEHVWHGEVVPYFPFLTNAVNPTDRAEMFREMGTSGVGMAVLVTLVWGGMVAISSLLEKRAQKEEEK